MLQIEFVGDGHHEVFGRDLVGTVAAFRDLSVNRINRVIRSSRIVFAVLL
jgi:hypothetical protein